MEILRKLTETINITELEEHSMERVTMPCHIHPTLFEIIMSPYGYTKSLRYTHYSGWVEAEVCTLSIALKFELQGDTLLLILKVS